MKTILTKVNNIYTLMKGDKMFASSDLDFQIDYEVKKLSKENCDEIFGVINIIDLAERNSKHSEEDYIEGFNKAVELNKDKLFTEADMIKFADDVYKLRKENKIFEGMPKLLQSLQQPKEIEVEIRCYIGNGDKESDSFKDLLVTNTGIPKLDENDCLILKKK